MLCLLENGALLSLLISLISVESVRDVNLSGHHYSTMPWPNLPYHQMQGTVYNRWNKPQLGLIGTHHSELEKELRASSRLYLESALLTTISSVSPGILRA